MHIEVISNIHDFAKLREHWHAVYYADPEAQFFLSWTWLSRYVKGKSRWFILAAKPDHDTSLPPVAFFPLRLRTIKTKDGGTRQVIAMAGNRGSDYTGFLCVPEFEADAITAFARYITRHDWDILCLENILASDRRTHLFLKNFPTDRFDKESIKLANRGENTDNYICPYVVLSNEWENYLSGKLGSSTRAKIRRLLRKLDSSGEFRITHAGPETIDSDLDTLLRLWGSQWKARKGKSLNNIQHFLREMLKHCFESGSLFLPVLWNHETPLGASACLIDEKNRSLLFYVGGRDETITSPPPGFVLHAYSIRYAINNGFRTYDFLRGNEPYKYLFGAEERRIRYIIVRAKNRQRTSARRGSGSPSVLAANPNVAPFVEDYLSSPSVSPARSPLRKLALEARKQGFWRMRYAQLRGQ